MSGLWKVPDGKAWKVLGAAIVVVGCVTGLISVIIDYGGTRPPTLDAWSTAAASACERNFQGVMQPVVTVFPLVAQVMARMRAGGGVDFDTAREISEQAIEISGAFRKLSGDLRAIAAPGDDHEADIDGFVGSATRISTIFAEVSVVMSKFAGGTVTADDMSGALRDMQGFDDALHTWSTLSTRLNVAECNVFGNGEPVSPSVSPSVAPSISPSVAPSASLSVAPSPSDDPAADLVAMIRSDVLTGCEPVQSITTPGAVAAVNCTAAGTGLTKRPLVLRFADAASMTAWIRDRGSSVVHSPGSQCADGTYDDTWQHDGVPAGSLVCEQAGDQQFRIAWTIDAYGVAVAVDGADGPETAAWWSRNAYLITA